MILLCVDYTVNMCWIILWKVQEMFTWKQKPTDLFISTIGATGGKQCDAITGIFTVTMSCTVHCFLNAFSHLHSGCLGA